MIRVNLTYDTGINPEDAGSKRIELRLTAYLLNHPSCQIERLGQLLVDDTNLVSLLNEQPILFSDVLVPLLSNLP